MLSEIRQTEKDKHSMSSHIWNLKKNKTKIKSQTPKIKEKIGGCQWQEFGGQGEMSDMG